MFLLLQYFVLVNCLRTSEELVSIAILGILRGDLHQICTRWPEVTLCEKSLYSGEQKHCRIAHCWCNCPKCGNPSHQRPLSSPQEGSLCILSSSCRQKNREVFFSRRKHSELFTKDRLRRIFMLLSTSVLFHLGLVKLWHGLSALAWSLRNLGTGIGITGGSVWSTVSVLAPPPPILPTRDTLATPGSNLWTPSKSITVVSVGSFPFFYRR